MKYRQYTIRSVPRKVDDALRAEAKSSGKSLNQVTVEALQKATGTAEEPAVYHDLDWFIGNKNLGKEFDKAQAWLDSLPKDLEA